MHFGAHEGREPACKIKDGDELNLAKALRAAEEQLERYWSEDSDADRRMNAMESDHREALIREEERGYAKGIRDRNGALRKLSAELRDVLEWHRVETSTLGPVELASIRSVLRLYGRE
ncbi:MAG: hypothetical protein WDN04_13805 [Rhodospirillales bacterium]